jgi:DNA replication protein dnaC
LSEAIGQELLKKGNTVLYQTAPKLLSKLMEYKVLDIKKYNEMEDFLSTVDLLILDDFGSENITEAKKEEILNIINSRINNQKSMIISTNLSLKDIYKVYTDRVVSRIIGEFNGYNFKGADIRILKAKEQRKAG